MQRLLFAFSFLFCVLNAHTQTPTTLEGWAQRLEAFGKSIPQEEVFVHMDNTCYYLGDTIYYKVYSRLSSGAPSTLSRLLYVELLNQDGYLVERQKIEMKQGQGYGSFVLLDTLYGGFYELRAYTRWQLNWGLYEHPHTKYAEQWFYSKQMAKEYYRDYEKLYSRVFPVYDHPKQKGEYQQQMTVRPLRRYFKTKQETPKASVTFFPEGGNLVAGTTCRVAFEANDANGGEHLKGELTVRNKAGSVVAKTETKSRGRGSFLLDCLEGETYKAEFQWTTQGQTADAQESPNQQTFSLPQQQKEGCALQTSTDETGIHLVLQRRGAACQPLGVTCSNHGVLSVFRTLAEGDDGHVDLPVEELTTGVNQVTVFDADGRIYADRLVFVDKGDLVAQNIQFSGINDEGYAPYAPIDVHVKATGKASLSLAVRDSKSSDASYDSGNILTEMLLASQVKGFVEQPEYYFESKDDFHRYALDLLLMVQGWRRYDWVQMTTPGGFALTQPYERSELIMGDVNRYTAEEQEDIFSNLANRGMDEALMSADAQTFLASEFSDYASSDMIRKWEGARPAMYAAKILKNELHVSASDYADSTTDSRDSYIQMRLLQMYAQEGDEKRNGTTRTTGDVAAERFHENEGNLKREVLVHAEFVQPGQKNGMVTGEMETFNKGKFKIECPNFYEACFFFCSASDSTRWKEGREHIWTQSGDDKKGRTEYPEFYVRLSRAFPRFVKPYTFYQENIPTNILRSGRLPDVDKAVIMKEVTIGAKRNGMRAFDKTKPAFVIDAYEAFNEVCDAGLCPGYYIGSGRFVTDIARNFIGDMNMHRAYNLEARYNTYNLTHNISAQTLEKYNHLTNLDRVYVYTDYSPRNEGSENYTQDNQPPVVVDLRRYEDDSQRMTWRDRRMLLTGFAICEDFYQPVYTSLPQGEATDYRRTLYWNPNLQLDENGEADVRFYNNSTSTLITVSAEGMTASGQPLTGMRYPQE